MRSWLPLLGALAVFVSSQAPLPAQAQAPERPDEPAEAPPSRPPPPPDEIEEIVILGEESDAAKDFAAGDSVTGFSAADLEALGAQSVADLASFTPNLEIVTTGATTPTFFIRGVGLNDFSPNSSGAVALFQDDVQINAPALQLGTLFDVETVNVFRGPQGTGSFLNASAGAIKIYSRKPSGDFGATFRADYGNFDYRDFEGSVEAPIYEDILAARVAFRLTKRDGLTKNRCANAPPQAERQAYTGGGISPQFTTDDPVSLCGERVDRLGSVNDRNRKAAGETINLFNPSPGTSFIPEGLPSRIDTVDVWATRATMRFQPTLDQTWLLSAHLSRRDQLQPGGQSYGVNPPTGFNITSGDFLGGEDLAAYMPREVREDFFRRISRGLAERGLPNTIGNRNAVANTVVGGIARDLASDLDAEPFEGDYNNPGPTRNDTWGAYLRGDIVLPNGVELRTITAFDAYDRLLETDLDFSPNILFEIRTDDAGWQGYQDLRLEGALGEEGGLRWNVGAIGLVEQLDVEIDNRLGGNAAAVLGIAERAYTQDLRSLAGYGGFEYDFWDDFTLDGGVRYNWQEKSLDFLLKRPSTDPQRGGVRQVWQAPTGTIRLTYRFREDTHTYWKYTRGWKGGHFNTIVAQADAVTLADPETLNAFEWGVRGSWLAGRLHLDGSLFYYDYDDYQLFITQQAARTPPEFVVINASAAEVFGSEIDLTARPLPGTFLNARFSWLESRFLDFVQVQEVLPMGAPSRRVDVNNTNNRLLNSPQFKISLTAEQTVPLGRLGSLALRWDGTWTDDTFYDAQEGRGFPNADGDVILPENAIAQEAYWLHNVRVGYRPPTGTTEVAFWVRNLTDKVYKTYSADAVTFSSTTIHFLGQPRTYGVSLSTYF